MESLEIIREPESYDGHIGTQGLFDVVAELLEDDLMVRHQKIMTLYLKCDLLIIDDMGTKQLPPKSGYYLFEIVMRRYEVKSTMMTVEPTPRRMGQANRRRTRRHGYPRPIPSPRPNHQDQR